MVVACELAERRLDPVDEGSRDALIVELEPVPEQPQDPGGDRAAGDTRDPVEAGEDACLVQPPEHADVEEHRPVAAAGEAERRPLRRPSILVAGDRADRLPQLGPGPARLG